MKIEQSSLVGTFEQKKTLVSAFNLMHDDFFAIVMKDNEVCEYVLKILLGKEVKVHSVHTQYALRNISSHSVVLDVLVEDLDHKLYNVEIQVADNDDHIKRVRYYQAAIDWSVLQKGKKYSELPELYLIYISMFDIFKQNKSSYEISRTVKGTDIEADNGVHEMYFNTQADDGTKLSQLLHYFRESDPTNNDFGALSKAVKYYKNDERGVSAMCKAVREYGDERAAASKMEEKIKTVKRAMEKGNALSDALEYAGLDEKTYYEYVEKFSAGSEIDQ